MRIGFVCTNYNGSGYTRSAVASLFAARGSSEVRVVIVDNRSSEADIAALEGIAAEFNGVELILNKENIGYFPGLNVGIRHLRTRFPDVDHMIVGNNDLTFPDTLVERLGDLRDVFEDWAVVAPDLVTPDGAHQNPHVTNPISPARKLVWDLYFSTYWAALVILRATRITGSLTVRPERAPDSELFKVPGPIRMGLGACYVLGPVFFRHFTKFCAPTLLMQEEFFLSEQLKSIGQMPYYDPRLVIGHRDHATMNRVPGRDLWRISRDAHRVYKAYITMPPDQQASFITARSTG